MTVFLSPNRRYHWVLASITLIGLVALISLPMTAQSGKAFIVQTNSAGDSVSLIDPVTDRIAFEIPDAEVIHGAAAAPDGSHLYLSNESLQTVDVVDTRTMKITKRIPLTGGPNNIAITKDGKKAYVAITGAQGGLDVIDLVSETKGRFIRILGGVHNPFMTPDGKNVVAGSTGGSVATVVDTTTDRAVWSIHFEGGVRPITFEPNSDGSTKRMFVQITDLHGFAIVDWAQRKEVNRIKLPDIPEAQRNNEGIQGAPAHGLLIPDGKTLWSTSKVNSAIYVYQLSDMKYLGEVKVGLVPDWITATPDGKKMYVANAHDNTVSIIDVPGRKEITRIKVGQIPKRNITAIIPIVPTTNQ